MPCVNLAYPVEVLVNGSGDKTYDYVQAFLFMIIAIIAAIIWTVADRKRKNYDLLLYWITVYIRYYLAFTMISYGFYKIIKLQFPYPSLYTLLEPYGQSSPMGLAWNFMGYSKAFSMFTGLAEAVGGFLLLFRRTATFGSLMLMTVLSNIVMMNFCYDIPVKLFSLHLLLKAVFIMLPDARRLIYFFFLNKPVPTLNIKPRFNKKWTRITWFSVKTLLILLSLYSTISGPVEGYKKYGEAAPKPPLYGIYNVETFIMNKDTLLPLTTDTLRWKTLIVNWPNSAGVKLMNDSLKYFSFKADTGRKNIEMYSYNDTTKKSYFTYQMLEKDSIMLLHGKWRDDAVFMRMKKYDVRNFLLVNREFNWINEYPFNR